MGIFNRPPFLRLLIIIISTVMNFPSFESTGLRLYSAFLPTLLLLFSLFGENTEQSSSSNAHKAITVDISANTPLCAGSILTLGAVPNGGTEPYTYAWAGPAGFTANSATAARADMLPAHAGTYGVTVTDNTGMTGTGSVNVVVNTPAIANAGPDRHVCKGTKATLNGSIGGSATSASWLASIPGGTFSPNSSALNVEYTPPPNYEGNISFTLITDDPAGPCPSVADQVIITFFDTEGLVCNDLVEIALDNDCSVEVTPDMVLEGDVPEELFSVTIFSPNGIPLGNVVTGQFLNQTLRVRVNDLCNGNICFTNAKIVDRVPPTMVCPELTLSCAIPSFTPEYLKNTLNVPGAYPDVTDNCSPFTLVHTDVWTDVPCGGSINGRNDVSAYIRRTWEGRDASGNKSECVQYIYFKRITLADIKFPSNANISCRTPNTSPSATGTPYVTQFGKNFNLHPNAGYCETSVTFTDVTAPACAGTYSIIRTWQAFDFCKPTSPLQPDQNPITYQQVISVRDFSGPYFQCPSDITVNTSLLSCCANMPLPSVIVGDSCSRVNTVIANVYTIDPVTKDTTAQFTCAADLKTFPGNNLNVSDTLATFNCSTPCLPVGVHRVVYTATDACGQTNICAFNATVADLVPPVAACDEITQVSLGIDGMIRVNATTFDDGSYDNCGSVYFKARRKEFDPDSCQRSDRFHDQVKFCCSDVGDTVVVILRIYDTPPSLGAVTLDTLTKHSNECEVQVYVDDKLRPVCVSPPNMTVDCENFDPSLWAYGFATAADNCCLDTITAAVNYSLFDTSCNKGTIIRTFRAFDCIGQSSTCTQQVVVNYRQYYFVKFPDDKMITECDGSGVYGKPEFFGADCELLATSFRDDTFVVVPDACFKIERHWKIINWCSFDPNSLCIYIPNPNPNATLNHASNLPGPIVSEPGTTGPWAPTVVKINPTDPTATNYSRYWSTNPNCYTYTQVIKILDKQKPILVCPGPQEVCDLSDNHPQLWNNNAWYDPICKTHDLCEAPADLCITATDACSGSYVNIRYLLFLDVDNNGTMETVINSVNTPPPGTIYYNNAGNPNYLGGTPLDFDNRNVATSVKRRFDIRVSTDSTSKTACVSWSTAATPNSSITPELPYGKHKIKWIIEDGCGNEQVCEYPIHVKDCKAPVIYCKSGLAVNIMPTGMVPLYASFFIEGAIDNCTPKDLIEFSIRKAGTGTGFPLDAQGRPISVITFDCTELGLQLVEVWARDKAGNSDFCRTYVLVQDNGDICGPKASVAGLLKTESGAGLQEANIEIKGQLTNGLAPLTMIDLTDEKGKYGFSNAIPIAADYTLTPLRDDNPLNGVSTLDLALISKHVLGVQTLGSPYKIIAADVNNSKNVTTFDVVELRKLILGIQEDFSNNTSWRFVDKAHIFPNPVNPFQNPFPESKTFANLQNSRMDEDFVSIKVGDVNGSAIANSLTQADDRSEGTLFFDLENPHLKAGEYAEAIFTASEVVEGYQFTLRFPDLELEQIAPGPQMGLENFGVFTEAHTLTTSFNGTEKGTFRVRFRAKKSGRLSEMLFLSGRVTAAEAYKSQGEGEKPLKMEVALRFKNNESDDTMVQGLAFELYQNQPNPFSQKTMIGFYLPIPTKPGQGDLTKVALTIYDENGKALHREEGNFPPGYSHFSLDSDELPNMPNSGMLYYKVEAGLLSETKKMVKVH